eukprot:scaffold2930_cov244-Pinguiococcus_pyrenoidosus.AAC.8
MRPGTKNELCLPRRRLWIVSASHPPSSFPSRCTFTTKFFAASDACAHVIVSFTTMTPIPWEREGSFDEVLHARRKRCGAIALAEGLLEHLAALLLGCGHDDARGSRERQDATARVEGAFAHLAKLWAILLSMQPRRPTASVYKGVEGGRVERVAAEVPHPLLQAPILPRDVLDTAILLKDLLLVICNDQRRHVRRGEELQDVVLEHHHTEELQSALAVRQRVHEGLSQHFQLLVLSLALLAPAEVRQDPRLVPLGRQLGHAQRRRIILLDTPILLCGLGLLQSLDVVPENILPEALRQAADGHLAAREAPEALFQLVLSTLHGGLLLPQLLPPGQALDVLELEELHRARGMVRVGRLYDIYLLQVRVVQAVGLERPGLVAQEASAQLLYALDPPHLALPFARLVRLRQALEAARRANHGTLSRSRVPRSLLLSFWIPSARSAEDCAGLGDAPPELELAAAPQMQRRTGALAWGRDVRTGAPRWFRACATGLRIRLHVRRSSAFRIRSFFGPAIARARSTACQFSCPEVAFSRSDKVQGGVEEMVRDAW